MKKCLLVLLAATIMWAGTFLAAVGAFAIRNAFIEGPFPVDYAVRMGVRNATLAGVITLIAFSFLWFRK